jgi:hypothetical protein
MGCSSQGAGKGGCTLRASQWMPITCYDKPTFTFQLIHSALRIDVVRDPSSGRDSLFFDAPCRRRHIVVSTVAFVIR